MHPAMDGNLNPEDKKRWTITRPSRIVFDNRQTAFLVSSHEFKTFVRPTKTHQLWSSVIPIYYSLMLSQESKIADGQEKISSCKAW